MPKYAAATKPKGGGRAMYAIVPGTTWSGANVLSWVELPIIKSGNLSDDTAIEELEDESGAKYPVPGVRTVKLKMDFMQRDKGTIMLATSTLKNLYCAIVWQFTRKGEGIDPATGAANATNIDYFFAPACQVIPKLEFSRPGADVSVEFNILENPTVSTVVTPSNTQPTGFDTVIETAILTVAAKEYWAIITDTTA